MYGCMDEWTNNSQGRSDHLLRECQNRRVWKREKRKAGEQRRVGEVWALKRRTEERYHKTNGGLGVEVALVWRTITASRDQIYLTKTTARGRLPKTTRSHLDVITNLKLSSGSCAGLRSHRDFPFASPPFHEAGT